MQVEIKLYGTEFCHLCDAAAVKLRELVIDVDYIEIANGDDELLESYGMRIPVLKRMDTGAELGWPFDATVILQFLDL